MSEKQWQRKYLTQNELEEAIKHLSDSEDDLDNEDMDFEVQNEDIHINDLPIELEDGVL